MAKGSLSTQPQQLTFDTAFPVSAGMGFDQSFSLKLSVVKGGTMDDWCLGVGEAGYRGVI